MAYDYLIVGCGLFGSVCARELTDKGYKCLIIDKKNHIGGHCYSENIEGINVHMYGPHIFHTSNEQVWNYMNRFCSFNNFTYRPKVSFKNKLYSFPINLLTLYQVFGVKTPTEAKEKLASVRIKNDNPQNLEEYILSVVGKELYEIFIKGYTTKQWRKDPKELPSSIIKRIPVRLTFDDNYFFDKYQGIPIGSYTNIFTNLLNGIEVKLGVNYFNDRKYFNSLAKTIIYTGPIDEFYDYQCGNLEYLTLRFEKEFLKCEDYQGVASVNFTESSIPYTRIIEHKHFEFGNQPHTIITKEYPEEWNITKDPYYPINNNKNEKILCDYKNLCNSQKNVIFGGRLAEYKYYDMDDTIEKALLVTGKL
jgi:UDP-galactopyranose mutase